MPHVIQRRDHPSTRVRFRSERCPLSIGTLSAFNRNGCPLSIGIRNPFHSQPFHRVSFDFTCDTDVVIGWCEKQMRQRGWLVVREILFSEYANAGGDWVRVYGRGNALVRIHIFGVNSRLSEENRRLGYLAVHQVWFDLIQTTPNEFFGWAHPCQKDFR